jgi:predicted aminopeptidase
MLIEYQRDLNQQGYDTYVADVAAYSTLGWFDDPALSTFIDWQEYKLVGLIFHELAHQKIYIEDDTYFNESFATAVQQMGLKIWFSEKPGSDQWVRYRDEMKRKAELYRLVERASEELDELYQQDIPDEEKRKQKSAILKDLRDHYKPSSGNWERLELNNASLGMMTAYNKFVPSFLAILEYNENDFPRFYSYVSAIGRLQTEQRKQCLMAWSMTFPVVETSIEAAKDVCEVSPAAVAMKYQ